MSIDYPARSGLTIRMDRRVRSPSGVAAKQPRETGVGPHHQRLGDGRGVGARRRRRAAPSPRLGVPLASVISNRLSETRVSRPPQLAGRIGPHPRHLKHGFPVVLDRRFELDVGRGGQQVVVLLEEIAERAWGDQYVSIGSSNLPQRPSQNSRVIRAASSRISSMSLPRLAASRWVSA